MGTSWPSIVQWLLASLCGLYYVHGLRVSSLCHIARCQTVTMYNFLLGVSNGFFSIPLSPWSFFIIFTILSIWPFGFNQLFACLIRAAIFHLTLAFVLIFFLFNFATGFFFQFLSWLLFFFFCHRHLRSVSLSACLTLVLVFRVSVYPSSHF